MTSPSVPPLDDAHSVILGYLRRLGYRQTEQLFREESRLANPTGSSATSLETLAFELRTEQDVSVTDYVQLNPREPSSTIASTYETSYAALTKWTNEALDAFREELRVLLWPIFVHGYLDLIAKGLSNDAARFLTSFRAEHEAIHGDELTRLAHVSDPTHLRESGALANAYRSNKYTVPLSAYAFQLLMAFLQEGHHGVLLKIVNQFINVRVLVARPIPGVREQAPTGLTGAMPETLPNLNKIPITNGIPLIDAETESRIMARLKTELAASAAARTPEQLNNLAAQIRKALPVGDTSLPLPDLQKIPKPPAGQVDVINATERLQELHRRVILGPAVLPSIACYTLHNTAGSITSLDFSPDASMLAAGNANSHIDLWNIRGERLLAMRPSTELAAMDFAEVSSVDPLLEPNGSSTKRLIGHSGPVYASRFSPDHRFLLSASQDSSTRLWSLATFANVVVYKSHVLPVWDLDMAPFGFYFATASADRTAMLWNTEHIQPLRMFAGHLSDVDCVKFHPNANYIATGSSDRTCRLWDIQSGKCVRLFTGHNSPISCLSISPDGKYLASASHDNSIMLWDLGEGRPVKKYVRHSSIIYSLDFCQDTKILASGGADRTINIWDVKASTTLLSTSASNIAALPTVEPLASFPTKQTPIFRAQFSPRNVLLTAGFFEP